MKHRKWLRVGIRAGVMAVWGCASVYAQSPSIDIQPASVTIFIGDEATFEVQASGADPLSYQWLRDGAMISGATNNPLSFTPSVEDDGALFSVHILNRSGSIISEAGELTIDLEMDVSWHTNRLVEITTPWRYDVNKTDLGSSWSQTNYSDSSWASGGGLLYVESSGLPAPKTTALPLVAKNLPTTCYFRTWFTNDMSDAYSFSLVANTVVDDGAIVYLNGAEVLRYNLDEGPVSYTNFAHVVANAAFEGSFELATDSLVLGTNLLAVEVHQTSTTSSDVVMGLTLDVVWQERVRAGPIGSSELVFSHVVQSSDFSASTEAVNAADDSSSSYSLTQDVPGSYWMAELGRPFEMAQIQIMNRLSPDDAELEGLTLSLFNMDDQLVFETILSNPGPGGIATINLPEGTTARAMRIGLSGTDTNGAGNDQVGMVDVRLFGVPNIPYSPEPFVATEESAVPEAVHNLASFKRSYMLRLKDSLPAASNANDDNISTEVYSEFPSVTKKKTADCYWEVDLGETFALYGVRAIDSVDMDGRLSHTICRLYDENHDPVFERRLSGEPRVYDIDVEGPVLARYVWIGLEDKERTSLDGSVEWYIGFSEVQVFGRPVDDVGVQSFTASSSQVAAGQSVTLDWLVEDVKRAEIFPTIGTVGAYTATNGVGSLSTAVTESTEFVLLASNSSGIFSRAVGVEVDGSPLSVQISEVVANNTYSLEDGYGDAPDWIELRNTGNSTVDLTGWGLSDEASDSMKWVFPATNMPPHSTLIVFASKNDDSIDPAGKLHADFKLSSDGDSVYLTASDGFTTVDSLVDFPELTSDLAYGRGLDGEWTFLEPTPDALNSGATYEGWLKSLDWSHARGFHETNFTLTVTSENPETTILYSLDGSVPSIPYATGLSIDGTEAVRIQPVRAGYKSPRIQTKTFIFLDDVITSSVMDTAITQDPAYASRLKPGLMELPTLSLAVPDALSYDEQEASIEVLWPNGENNPVQENFGISRYGGSFTTFDKLSVTLAFRSKYGAGKLSTPLFNGFDRGLLAKTSFDQLQLHGGNQDESRRGFSMSDRFVQDSFLDMDCLNPHGRYVHVYLNGIYWGMYNCKEVLKEGFMADYMGGEKDDYVNVKGNDNNGGSFVIGVGDPPDIEPWEQVRALAGDYQAILPHLDVSHYIDYMLLWGYGGAEAEFRACGPKEVGCGHKMWMNDPDGFLQTGIMGKDKITSQAGPGDIWGGLRGQGHVDFKMLLADRIYKNYFNNGAMTPTACDARLVMRMDEIRDSIVLERARWSTMSPNAALTPTQWESKADNIRENMFPYRTDQLVTKWRSVGYLPSFDPPTFNQFGGPVEEGFQPVLTSSAGTIYYTLDGTDPRLPGGAISTLALVWVTGAVTIAEDFTLMARVRASDGTWSALADPRYLLGSRQSPVVGDLLITEVNYNPDGSNEYEFIEIWNSGTNFLDLSGVNISNAVRYIFPEYSTLSPGAHVVVCEDIVAFSNRYQNAASPWYWADIEVSGEWVGGLSDGGETIFLAAADGSPISSVSYNVGGDWPDHPDGGGSSLELSNPIWVPSDASAQSAYLADGRNWTASSLYHGSPGRFESAVSSVVINEILSHTDVGVDWIELYNGSESPVDLTGYALTDDLEQPMRYVFPADSMVPANGYLTISSADFGFGFSELGSSASLLEVSGSTVLRFLDRVEFPAVAREESFGRYLRSDDIPVFTEQASNTYGDENSLPRVGPVVISEIMVIPTVGKSAYVELYNISESDVPLYDLNSSSNVWTFSGVGNYAFPEGVVLPPLTPMILCATNPAVFRAQYGLDASVPVYGPWSGGLDADGEMLELLSSGDLEPDGFVPRYRADYVAYRTNETWAVVGTGGVSLERYPINSYGNDPASWVASAVSGSPGTVGEYRSDLHSDISMVPGGSPVIGFPAILGQSYEVHYTDSLTSPLWNILQLVPEAATNWINVTDPELPVSNRYYRIYWELN